MTLPPRAPLNVGLLSAYDRLGILGGVLPGLVGELVPVAVMTDLARTLASELVEARKSCTLEFAPSPGRYAVARLRAASPGGLVVEQMLAFTGDPGIAGELRFLNAHIGAASNLGVATGPPNQADIGGIATVSSVETFDTLTNPFIIGVPFFRIPCPTQIFPGGVLLWVGETQGRIFLRASEHLTVWAFNNQRLGLYITWRELSEAQGTSP